MASGRIVAIFDDIIVISELFPDRMEEDALGEMIHEALRLARTESDVRNLCGQVSYTYFYKGHHKTVFEVSLKEFYDGGMGDLSEDYIDKWGASDYLYVRNMSTENKFFYNINGKITGLTGGSSAVFKDRLFFPMSGLLEISLSVRMPNFAVTPALVDKLYEAFQKVAEEEGFEVIKSNISKR